MLESLRREAHFERFSIFGCDSVAEIDEPIRSGTDPFVSLAAVFDGRQVASVPGIPLTCGWVGSIPYELGAVAEGVLPVGVCDSQAPRVRLALYDTVAAYDHAMDQWLLGGADLPDSRVSVDRRLARLESLLTEAGRSPLAAATLAQPHTCKAVATLPKADYLARIHQAKEHIRAGDIYQVNLTNRFDVPTGETEPFDLYRRLRQINPSGFAAYLPYPDQTILSSSPELLLHGDGDRVVTRPIKGTRPRTDDTADDDWGRAALLASEKDRAELNMITDLLRNDLGRICQFGSVRVLNDAKVETHPTVFHLVSTIAGRLRSDASGAEILRAILPGGSVTGCPKIRAMQIISELEHWPRDAYCGAIGYLGLDGRLCLNVAIRTMIHRGTTLHVYAGGAITADSDPESEYTEMLAKAKGMLQAAGCTAEPSADTVGLPTPAMEIGA